MSSQDGASPRPGSAARQLAALTLLSTVPLLLTWRFGPQSGMEALILLLPWLGTCAVHALLGPIAVLRARDEGRSVLAAAMGLYLLAFAVAHLALWAAAQGIPERLEELYVEYRRPLDHELSQLARGAGAPAESIAPRALELVEAGADPDRILPRGGTLLTQAAGSNPEFARALLRAGADPDLRNREGSAPIHAAIRNGQLATARLLLENGADPDLADGDGTVPLCRVISTGITGTLGEERLALVEGLVRAGADPAACDAVSLAAGLRQADTLRVLLEAGHRASTDRLDSTLLAATRQREIEWLPLLVRAGADPSASLSLAIERRWVDGVRALLEAGADARARPYLVGIAGRPEADPLMELLLAYGADPLAADDKGRTPLIEAVRGAHDANIRRLVALGADPDQEFRGEPLVVSLQTMIPAEKHVTALLLELGADPDRTGLDGDTALMRATRNSHHELMRALFRAGADVSKRDERGWTALHHAGHTRFEVARSIGMLVAAGVPIERENALGETALCLAQQDGNRAAAQALLALGARDPGCENARQRPPVPVIRSIRTS